MNLLPRSRKQVHFELIPPVASRPPNCNFARMRGAHLGCAPRNFLRLARLPQYSIAVYKDVVIPMIAVNGLSKRFGHLLAVENISLTVARGEVLGFMGPNGSGKSTTMKMITGFLTPSSGTAEIGGVDIRSNPIAAQRQMGYLPEGAPVYADITVSAYLNFIAEIRGLTGQSGRRAIDFVVERTHLKTALYQTIETLSKGYKRRVGLAQALLHDPDVLILDEPTDGLDPNQKHEVRNLIREISEDKAIIISTHILEEVETVCTRALIIANGRVVIDETPREIEQRSRYFNAVSLTLGSNNTEVIRTEIEALPGVTTTETFEDADSHEVTALAEPGANILSVIARLARDRDWPVEQLQLRQGHLDEVFRELTNDVNTTAPKTLDKQAERTKIKSPGTTWRDTRTIFKRELLGYFSTPIASVFIVIFLATIGALTFFLGGFFEQGQANLESFFQFHPWLYLFLIPAIAMRLWAEERKTGSIELLLTLPVSTLSAVLGKFTAAWLVTGLALILTFPLWITVNYLGSPDHGVIAASYAGSFFMAGGYLAIGVCVSAMTKNQVIAFIIAAALSFVFTVSGLSLVLEFFSGWAPQILLDTISNLSFLEHFRDITRGVVDVRDLVFFSTTILFFLFANIVAVERNKNA